MEGAGKIVFVAAGASHTVALAEGGVLWVWGFGKYGQLGLATGPNAAWDMSKYVTMSCEEKDPCRSMRRRIHACHM